jgi:DNA-binding NarL/FixJ family response regulator
MINVFLVDDHALFRHGLKLVLGQSREIHVVGEAACYGEAVEKLRGGHVDVLAVDLSLPGRDGIDLIAYLRSAHPGIAILVLTMHDEEEYAARALRAGAAGYLTKDSTADHVIAAVNRVAAGGSYMCPRIAENLALRVGRGSGDALPHTALSGREYKVFEMLVQGNSITGIARELSLSSKTVSTHKMRLLRKMSMRSENELVRYAVKHQLGVL